MPSRTLPQPSHPKANRSPKMNQRLGGAFAAILALAISATAVAEVRLSSGPVAKKSGDKTTISFAVSEAADVEVAVLDADGNVVRHLAAGVLGAKNPPPEPLKEGLSQSIEWDGRDDSGKPVPAGQFKVRVRAGMTPTFGRIIVIRAAEARCARGSHRSMGNVQ